MAHVINQIHRAECFSTYSMLGPDGQTWLAYCTLLSFRFDGHKDALNEKSLSYKLDVEPLPYKLPRTRPIVIGHRGSIYEEPENTIPSFERAISLGCDGIETDAFVVDCGTVIAFHADDSSGTHDEYCGTPGNIMEYTYEEVEQLPLNPDEKIFPCPERKVEEATIPTMEEVLILCKKAGITAFLELKGPDTEEPLLEIVDKHDMADMAVFVSFQEDRLRKIHELRPQRDADGKFVYRVALLFIRTPKNFIELALSVEAAEVHLRYDACTNTRVNAIHAAGMRSLAWCGGPKAMKKDGTIKYLDVDNEDEDMYQCVLNTGVQGMCVNRPKLLLEMVENLPTHSKLAEALVDVGGIDVSALPPANPIAENLVQDVVSNLEVEVEVNL